MTVIATGFSGDSKRVEAPFEMPRAFSGEPAPAAPAAPAPPAAVRTAPVSQAQAAFDLEDTESLPGDDGMLPNFSGNYKDNLDVPAFLRKQMD